jgi:hypothetical protein
MTNHFFVPPPPPRLRARPTSPPVTRSASPTPALERPERRPAIPGPDSLRTKGSTAYFLGLAVSPHARVVAIIVGHRAPSALCDFRSWWELGDEQLGSYHTHRRARRAHRAQKGGSSILVACKVIVTRTRVGSTAEGALCHLGSTISINVNSAALSHLEQQQKSPKKWQRAVTTSDECGDYEWQRAVTTSGKER